MIQLVFGNRRRKRKIKLARTTDTKRNSEAVKRGTTKVLSSTTVPHFVTRVNAVCRDFQRNLYDSPTARRLQHVHLALRLVRNKRAVGTQALRLPSKLPKMRRKRTRRGSALANTMHICKHQVPCSATQCKPDHRNPLLYTLGIALEMPKKETFPR